MAKLKLLIDTRNKEAHRFPLVIRVSHRGKWKYLQTGYKLALNEWNDKTKQIRKPYPNVVRANTKVLKKITAISEVLSEHSTVIKSLTLNDLLELINKKLENEEKKQLQVVGTPLQFSKTTLKEYGEKVIKRYKKAKRFGMARSFEDAIGMVLKYYGGNNLLISDINEIFLEDLEANYIGEGNKLNGLGVRLRAIRRIYNLAIKDKDTELTMESYPFGHGGYSIKTERTKKRAVKFDAIQKIRSLNYKNGSSLWHHRNYFLFMLNMRGMNFIDLAFLRRSAVSKGRVKYKRTKTKRGQSVKEFDIKITKEARFILAYYMKGKAKDDLIFPIMEDVIKNDDDLRTYEVYQSRLCNHNRRLITIGKDIGLQEHLTTYVARHTFASLSLHNGVSKAQVGDMMGHTSYYTTETYCADFENEVLDESAKLALG